MSESRGRSPALTVNSFADQLARFRAHTQGLIALPPDVAAWALKHLEEHAPIDYQRLRRDQHLRRAGALIGGGIRYQAREILRIGVVVEREWNLERFEGYGEIPGLWHEISAARRFAPLPASRQLRNILKGGQSAP